MPARAQNSSSYWVFTLNNPTPQDDITLQFDNWPTKPSFAIYNLEFGDNQTPHYQGYFELPCHKTLQWVKNRIPRAHVEPRRGNRHQAIIYCLKDCSTNSSSTPSSNGENGNDLDTLNMIFSTLFPIVYGYSGTWQELKEECQTELNRKMGRKEALQQMKVMIENGATDNDLANFNFSTWCSCNRSLTLYRSLISLPRSNKPKIYICQGPTGTGKSRWAMENFPGAYWKQRSNWWDGYNGQKTVIIDEFYGWLPFDLCLRLCDHYPLLVETKGGNVNFNSENIIFTTNNLPSTWWKNCYFQSFARRIDEWHLFPVWGMHVFYKTYEEALPHFFLNE